jgi:hypothetical protein
MIVCEQLAISTLDVRLKNRRLRLDASFEFHFDFLCRFCCFSLPFFQGFKGQRENMCARL